MNINFRHSINPYMFFFKRCVLSFGLYIVWTLDSRDSGVISKTHMNAWRQTWETYCLWENVKTRVWRVPLNEISAGRGGQGIPLKMLMRS